MKEEIEIREIVRRRMLEAEIRRELVVEQELAMFRATGRTQGLALDRPLAMRLLDHRPLDDEKKCFILRKPDPEIFEAKKRKSEGHDCTEPSGPSGSRNSAGDKFICKMCSITTTSEITLKAHLEGKKHKTKEGHALQTGAALNQSPALQNKGGFKLWCQMCGQGSNSRVVMDTHYLGRKHMARL